MGTVLVFGSFDGLHDGHRFFLQEAKKFGTRLIVALAGDQTIQSLKGHEPRYSFAQRTNALNGLSLVDEIVESDGAGEQGTFAILDRLRPTVIALGYDQTALLAALSAWQEKHHLPLAIKTIDSYHPEKYHSSFLNGYDRPQTPS